MGLIRLYMTISLDGYVAGPQDSADEPMGVGGFRLFNWLDRRNDPGPNGQIYAEMLATRAVISGRRTYELAGRWQGDHHDGVPIVVLTHQIPDEPPPGSVRYVTDVREAAAQARAAAGDGDVMVHGAGVAQALLRARELDELELHVVPVLLGQGRRLFDHLPAEYIELSPERCLTPDVKDPAQRVTHMRYRVRSGNLQAVVRQVHDQGGYGQDEEQGPPAEVAVVNPQVRDQRAREIQHQAGNRGR